MGASQLRHLAPRREMVLVLLLGTLAVGLVFLAVRQGWAEVRTEAPRPLPGGDVTVTGQDLVPAAAALAIAALASLVAVLATRGPARRLVGLVLAGFGVGIGVTVSAGVTAAGAIAAAVGSGGTPGTAGSVTAGAVPNGSAPPIAGFASHVAVRSLPWQALALVGAVAVIAAGLLVTWRATRWPVMSSRFDPPERAGQRAAARSAQSAPSSQSARSAQSSQSARSAQPGQPAQSARSAQPARFAQSGQPASPAQPGQSAESARPAQPGQSAESARSAQPGQSAQPAESARSAQPGLPARSALAVSDSASIWESLSRGEDPTEGGQGQESGWQ
jgi:uncharacterized membrane protein (TIGR02234 family)